MKGVTDDGRRTMTRRKFLETSVAGSIVAGGATGVLGRAAAIAKGGTQAASGAPPGTKAEPGLGLNARQKKILGAALDELIPASDGMPSATEAGAREYLDRVARQEPGIARDLRQSLKLLDDMSQKNFGKAFVLLGHDERVRALSGFERSDAANFGKLRDYAYEAYYTQPRVWGLIGYEFHPTSGGGPAMQPFDPASLAEVRRKPKYYREVR